MTKEEKDLKEQVVNLLKESYRLRLTATEAVNRIITHIKNFHFINTPFKDRSEHNGFLLTLYRKDLKDALISLGAPNDYINDFLKFFPEGKRRIREYEE